MFNDIVRIDFTPELAKGPKAKFSGKVVMRVPHQYERFKVMKELGLKLSGKKVVIESDNFEQIIEVAKVAHSYFVESDLVDIETGKPVSEKDIFYSTQADNKWLELTVEMGKFIVELCLGKK